MTDLTPESPAVRLYTALHNISGQWLQDEKKLAPYFADVLTRLAAEHDRLVAERLAPVVAERARWEHDYWQSYAACERLAAAVSDRNEVDEKRAALHAEDLSKITAECDAAIADRDRLKSLVIALSDALSDEGPDWS